MHIQLVTFALEGISDTDLRVGAEAIAPQFTALPGLHSKVWISDPASNTYGGIYTWEDRDAMRSYLHGELYAAAVRDNPTFTGVRSRDFGVIEGATRITAPHRAVRV
jgi:hypothetical protein